MKTTNQTTELSERNLGIFVKGNSITTLYVGGLRYNKTEAETKKIFEKFGIVTYVRMICDRETKRSTGVAFIQMPNKTEAQKAIHFLNDREIDGRNLKVSIAIDNNKSKPKNNITTAAPKKYIAKKEKEQKEKEQEQELMARPPKKKVKKGLQALFAYKKSQNT